MAGHVREYFGISAGSRKALFPAWGKEISQWIEIYRYETDGKYD